MFELLLGAPTLDRILDVQSWRIQGNRLIRFDGDWVGEIEATPSGIYKVRLDKANIVVILAGLS